jgi:hypothetical protein
LSRIFARHGEIREGSGFPGFFGMELFLEREEVYRPNGRTVKNAFRRAKRDLNNSPQTKYIPETSGPSLIPGGFQHYRELRRSIKSESP